ncbi:MAG: MBL fold metallo-hydrolase [Candidatus Aminicenantes bacterium]|nr:MBL fold metallo-hydrolase [Candidatus Aminicenantes bacterium]
MNIESIIVGPLETNCYLVSCPRTLACAVVDPGAEPDRIIAAVHRLGLKPALILNTHGHFDHVGANRDIKDAFDIPLAIHALDNPMLELAGRFEMSFVLEAKDSPPADFFLQDKAQIPVGESRLEVLHTPGHSPGSVCLLWDGFLLSGDTLFNEGVGRTDLPGGSDRDLKSSLRSKILVLPPETRVLPGHGPRTTVGQEIASNPFLK